MKTVSAAQIEAVIAAAEKAHAQYPQYATHWRTPDWKPARITRTIRTKAGVAFEVGEVTIARWRTWEGEPPSLTAYSVRNGIDTGVLAGDVEWIGVSPTSLAVGVFTLEEGILSGPAAYMAEQGNARLSLILAGADAVFNTCAHLSPNVETAILVCLQTDWAGWKGAREMFGR